VRRVTEKNLGEKLAQFRKENNITQEELAEYLFVTRQAVSNWERGITKPDFTTLEKICGRLGVGIDEFVSSRTNKPQGQRDTDKKERKEFINMKKVNKYTVAIGLFYGAALFLGIGIFMTIGLIFNTPMVWAASFFSGAAVFLVTGLTVHGVITLLRKDNNVL
jgi:transcriptional regulator with XRE-family HTH domain